MCRTEAETFGFFSGLSKVERERETERDRERGPTQVCISRSQRTEKTSKRGRVVGKTRSYLVFATVVKGDDVIRLLIPLSWQNHLSFVC